MTLQAPQAPIRQPKGKSAPSASAASKMDSSPSQNISCPDLDKTTTGLDEIKVGVDAGDCTGAEAAIGGRESKLTIEVGDTVGGVIGSDMGAGGVGVGVGAEIVVRSCVGTEIVVRSCVEVEVDTDVGTDSDVGAG